MSAALTKAALIGLAKRVTGTDAYTGLPLPHRTSTNASGVGGFASGFAQGYGRRGERIAGEAGVRTVASGFSWGGREDSHSI